jgi:hypothetical protein
MVDLKKLRSVARYVTNREGEKTAVILLIEDFKRLLDDLWKSAPQSRHAATSRPFHTTNCSTS